MVIVSSNSNYAYNSSETWQPNDRGLLTILLPASKHFNPSALPDTSRYSSHSLCILSICSDELIERVDESKYLVQSHYGWNK